MSTRGSVPCRYFKAGTCRFGSSCQFSHTSEAVNVCKYFQLGHCRYGDKCMYDHVKPAAGRQCDPAWAAGTTPQQQTLAAAHVLTLTSTKPGAASNFEVTPEQPAWQPSEDAWASPHRRSHMQGDDGEQPESSSLCQRFQAYGNCSNSDACSAAHGLLCEGCGKWCLHPSDPEQQAGHLEECTARQERQAALKRSQEVECSICMERVLDKGPLSQRKFGLLDCDHPFCLACLRSWRAQTDSGADLDSALRSCPICRQQSWMVTPSAVWPTTRKEKAAIKAAYRAKLAGIDCTHFDRGRGTCPFGTSCFYRHAYPDGSLQVVSLRKRATADEDVEIVQSVRLSDFLPASMGRLRLQA